MSGLMKSFVPGGKLVFKPVRQGVFESGMQACARRSYEQKTSKTV
jgi:hypothetical protein